MPFGANGSFRLGSRMRTPGQKETIVVTDPSVRSSVRPFTFWPVSVSNVTVAGLPLIILRASNVRVLPRSTRGGFRPAE